MEFIDSHCHLQFDNYAADAEAVLANAVEAGVKRLICVGCTLADSKKAVDFAAKHRSVWAAVGAHPHDGADFLKDKQAEAKLTELLKQPKVVAMGEIGLDYYHQNSPKVDQQKSLRNQIELGLPFDLPFIFHIRDAWEDFWPIFDKYNGKGNIRGVVHSFSTTPKQLDEALSRGMYIGLNGIMTFTKDQQQLEAAKKVPLNRLLLETDAPFLTPKPFRGGRCEPKHVVNTAEFLADLRGDNLSELAAATTVNAEKLFGLEIRND